MVWLTQKASQAEKDVLLFGNSGLTTGFRMTWNLCGWFGMSKMKTWPTSACTCGAYRIVCKFTLLACMFNSSHKTTLALALQ